MIRKTVKTSTIPLGMPLNVVVDAGLDSFEWWLICATTRTPRERREYAVIHRGAWSINWAARIQQTRVPNRLAVPILVGPVANDHLPVIREIGYVGPAVPIPPPPEE